MALLFYIFPGPTGSSDYKGIPSTNAAFFVRLTRRAETVRATPLPPFTMCIICDRTAPKCGWVVAEDVEAFFMLSRRPRVKVRPPDLGPFLLELAADLEIGSWSPPAERPAIDERRRAKRTKKAPDAGTNDPPTPAPLAPVQCLAVVPFC